MSAFNMDIAIFKTNKDCFETDCRLVQLESTDEKRTIIVGVLIIGIGYVGIEMFELFKGVKADIPKHSQNFEKK